MNTLPSLTLGQKVDHEGEIEGHSVSDFVFDEFLAAEQLAFILSPSHLLKGLMRLTTKLENNSARLIENMLANESSLTRLHRDLLSRLNGFHIEEASIEEIDRFLEALDERYDAGWLGDKEELELDRKLRAMPTSKLGDYCEAMRQYLIFYNCGKADRPTNFYTYH